MARSASPLWSKEAHGRPGRRSDRRHGAPTGRGPPRSARPATVPGKDADCQPRAAGSCLPALAARPGPRPGGSAAPSTRRSRAGLGGIAGTRPTWPRLRPTSLARTASSIRGTGWPGSRLVPGRARTHRKVAVRSPRRAKRAMSALAAGSPTARRRSGAARDVGCTAEAAAPPRVGRWHGAAGRCVRAPAAHRHPSRVERPRRAPARGRWMAGHGVRWASPGRRPATLRSGAHPWRHARRGKADAVRAGAVGRIRGRALQFGAQPKLRTLRGAGILSGPQRPVVPSGIKAATRSTSSATRNGFTSRGRSGARPSASA